MSDLPVLASHKEVSKEEAEAHIASAFDLERKIKHAVGRVHESWWELSEYLYLFHEGGYWGALGYTTLEEFLGQPDLGLKRSTFFQMTKLWRDLIVVKQLPPSDLKEIEPSKVREVAPSIMRGEVEAEDALDDARAMSYRDIKTKYRPEKRRGNQKPDDSGLLEASDEPVLTQCEACGSWYEVTEDEGAA